MLFARHILATSCPTSATGIARTRCSPIDSCGPSLRKCRSLHHRSSRPILTVRHPERVEEIVKRVKLSHNLNADQCAVLDRCKLWFTPGSSHPVTDDENGVCTKADDDDSVVLVHGPFGTGKSSLLVALVQCLCEIIQSCGTGSRSVYNHAPAMTVDDMIIFL